MGVKDTSVLTSFFKVNHTRLLHHAAFAIGNGLQTFTMIVNTKILSKSGVGAYVYD